MKVQAQLNIRVGRLLVRERDVQPDALPAGLKGAFVGGFHDARAAAGDDGKFFLGQQRGGLLGSDVKRIIRLQPGRAKDGHRRADRAEGLKPIHKLRQYSKQPPCIMAVRREGIHLLNLFLFSSHSAVSRLFCDSNG
jgi:hypothetical protein